MGTSKWSDDVYKTRSAHLAATATSAFAYDTDVRATPRDTWKVHDRMNPFGVKFRESRDSAEHPTSLAVAVLFDVTGSMRQIPEVLQKKLGALMNLLISKGYVEHPQILFGAIGDATVDRVPLQVGQFESGNEMDDDLAHLVLEGGGGAHITESYELAMHFMARHTAIDCLEKRGEKGFLFIIGDEMPYTHVKVGEVNEIIGDGAQAGLSLQDIAEELKEKYNVFVLLPVGAANEGNREVRQRWQSLFDQNVFILDNPVTVAETIATTIGVTLGKVDLEMGLANLRDLGVDGCQCRHRSVHL